MTPAIAALRKRDVREGLLEGNVVHVYAISNPATEVPEESRSGRILAGRGDSAENACDGAGGDIGDVIRYAAAVGKSRHIAGENTPRLRLAIGVAGMPVLRRSMSATGPAGVPVGAMGGA